MGALKVIGNVIEANVEEGLEVNHVGGHVVGPLEDLGSDVDEEGVGRPTAENHDFGGGVIVHEQCHGCTGSEGAISDL